MSKNNNYIIIDTDTLDLLSENDNTLNPFSLYLEILKGMGYENRILTTSYNRISCRFRKTEREIKKNLFYLRDNGAIEIYKGRFGNCLEIVLRNCGFIEITGSEIFLNDRKIIKTPKSKARTDKGYDKFRKAVLKRDNYTCQLCGSKENLEVHHKKAYAKYIKLRTTVSNGITLCEKCHDKVHSRRCEQWETS